MLITNLDLVMTSGLRKGNSGSNNGNNNNNNNNSNNSISGHHHHHHLHHSHHKSSSMSTQSRSNGGGPLTSSNTNSTNSSTNNVNKSVNHSLSNSRPSTDFSIEAIMGRANDTNCNGNNRGTSKSPQFTPLVLPLTGLSSCSLTSSSASSSLSSHKGINKNHEAISSTNSSHSNNNNNNSNINHNSNSNSNCNNANDSPRSMSPPSIDVDYNSSSPPPMESNSYSSSPPPPTIRSPCLSEIDRPMSSGGHTPLDHRGTPSPSPSTGSTKDGSSSSCGGPNPYADAIKPRCNCEELSSVKCHLENKDLWDKFNELGTEMIITKSGRRMFPTVRVSFTGIDLNVKYLVLMDIIPVDNKRYRYAYHRSSWLVAGKADPPSPARLYLHPDAPYSADQLRKQVITFEKVKLTNNENDRSGHIVLNSMHKYQPRIHLIIYREGCTFDSSFIDMESERFRTFVFPETVFTAVTAYQNQLITKLKIDSNPFAKGFRDSSRLSDMERESMETLIGDPCYGRGPLISPFLTLNGEETASFLLRERALLMGHPHHPHHLSNSSPSSHLNHPHHQHHQHHLPSGSSPSNHPHHHPSHHTTFPAGLSPPTIRGQVMWRPHPAFTPINQLTDFYNLLTCPPWYSALGAHLRSPNPNSAPLPGSQSISPTSAAAAAALAFPPHFWSANANNQINSELAKQSLNSATNQLNSNNNEASPPTGGSTGPSKNSNNKTGNSGNSNGIGPTRPSHPRDPSIHRYAPYPVHSSSSLSSKKDAPTNPVDKHPSSSLQPPTPISQVQSSLPLPPPPSSYSSLTPSPTPSSPLSHLNPLNLLNGPSNGLNLSANHLNRSSSSFNGEINNNTNNNKRSPINNNSKHKNFKNHNNIERKNPSPSNLATKNGLTSNCQEKRPLDCIIKSELTESIR